MPSNPISYEVTVRTENAEVGREFASWMRREHIPTVLATGLFSGAEFAQLDEVSFRTRYLASSRDNLERYLAQHTARLRDDFARRFGGRATAAREVWDRLQAWP
ncbi:MAG TPA: DUF4286 family protein [Gemmatimonadales bacterium]|nr:DUF4286 family protein [Gemmatimonadales bacterium]